MKKIIAAGITKILEFDRKDEAETYLLDLTQEGSRHKVKWGRNPENGKTIIVITMTMNNKNLIKTLEEIIGEEEGNEEK